MWTIYTYYRTFGCQPFPTPIHTVGHTGVSQSPHLYILSDIQVSPIPHTHTYCRTDSCHPFPTPIHTVRHTGVSHSFPTSIHRLLSDIQVSATPHTHTQVTVRHTGVSHSPHPYIGYCRTYKCNLLASRPPALRHPGFQQKSLLCHEGCYCARCTRCTRCTVQPKEILTEFLKYFIWRHCSHVPVTTM